MAEAPAAAGPAAAGAGVPDLLQRRLMDLCDANGPELVGLCSAMEGLARIIRADAAQAGPVPPAVLGLCYVADQAEQCAGRIVEELHDAHRLASREADHG